MTITFLVRGLTALRQTSDHLAALRRILSPVSRRVAPPRWTPTTRKLRDALLALDGREAGASYYEVALVLHGREYVERNWRTGLKRSMRHHLRRGLELSRGGYRNLLR
ncbi:MAG: DNA -binding domain-containing protein [Hyphomicrobiaceae bacterium]